MNKVKHECPICSNQLVIRELHCNDCGISLRGEFGQHLFFGLSEEEQRFVFDFVLSSGSLKQMEEKLNKSYPTVRNILDHVIEKLKSSMKQEKKLGSRKDVVVNLVESGEITVGAAEKIIELLKL